uniref:Uncharacterized protein n=1 Tax=Oryza brachyantha TaxID=4533 RepID=J3M2W6_ORYBR
MAAAAAPNGNGNHQLKGDDGELNPAEQQAQPNDVDRVLERSLMRRIRVLGDTIRRLRRLFTFTQANNPGSPAAALLRIVERINRADTGPGDPRSTPSCTPTFAASNNINGAAAAAADD